MKRYIYPAIVLLFLFSLGSVAQDHAKWHSPVNAIAGEVSENTHRPDTVFGDFTEISPLDSIWQTQADEDFWVVATAPADYDNDGDLDIAVLGYYVVYNVSAVDRLILMRNEGPSGPDEWNFTSVNVPLGNITAGSSDMAWGDADGDGDLDLSVGSDGLTVIYRNDSGTLIQTSTALPGYWEENSQAYFDLRSITWVDFDNDGDADLLVPSVPDFSSFSFRTALMRNDGTDGTGGWIFSEVDSVFAPTSHAQSAWADFDSDGDLDLLLINIAPLSEDGFIRLYTNEGNEVFTGQDILGSLSVEHGEAQWGDYDGDGDLDILVAGNLRETNGSYTPMALRLFTNNNGAWAPAEVIPNPAAEGWVDFTAATWADYDSDGDMDILLAGHYNSGSQIEGRARILSNYSGVFSDSGNELPAPHASGDRGGTFSWLDIDGDGDLDYFIAGEYFVPGGNGLVEAQMHLYRNDAPGQNSAPLAPVGLSVTQLSDTSALLSWAPGLDDHTPPDALTYDLKLFHGNMPVDIPVHTPEPGNVSTVNEWRVTGLEPGSYTWKLSTVDAAYIGSPVTAGEFTMGPVSVKPQPATGTSGCFLWQNYPNPARGSTEIRFSSGREGMVSLKLYNSQGIELVTIVENNYPAGEHFATLDVADLPAGIYYYRMKMDGQVLSKRMIVTGGLE
jgi:hypothetical protein